MKFNFDQQPGVNRKQGYHAPVPSFMTIITPFYNAGRYFEQTFNCVLNQTFIWFEWIIVDDGSTSAEDIALLNNLSQYDSRIKLYHKNNEGPATARNYAVAKSKTKIIVSLDADDLIEPTYLEETYFALYFNPEASWAYTDSLGFGNLEYVWKVHFNSERLKKKNFLIEVGTFRKEIFDQVGGYDDRQKYSHEDWSLWLRFMSHGGYPVHIASLSAWYRIVDDGAFHKTNDDKCVKKRAYHQIKKEAKNIKEKISAIEYPRMDNVGIFKRPVCSDWIFHKRKRKSEILFLLSGFDNIETEHFWLAINKLNHEIFHMGIMILNNIKPKLKQQFMRVTEDVFELSTFLDIENYPEFISYYIKSRQVDCVLICNSVYGYRLVPWLKQEFVDLYAVGCIENVNAELYEYYQKFVDESFTYSLNGEDYVGQIKKMEKCLMKLLIDKKKGVGALEIHNVLINDYIALSNELHVYKKMYIDCIEEINKRYIEDKKKKLRMEAFRDTKFGDLFLLVFNKLFKKGKKSSE